MAEPASQTTPAAATAEVTAVLDPPDAATPPDAPADSAAAPDIAADFEAPAVVPIPVPAHLDQPVSGTRVAHAVSQDSPAGPDGSPSPADPADQTETSPAPKRGLLQRLLGIFSRRRHGAADPSPEQDLSQPEPLSPEEDLSQPDAPSLDQDLSQPEAPSPDQDLSQPTAATPELDSGQATAPPPGGILRLLELVLRFVNAPFRFLSPGARQVIGLAAMVTLAIAAVTAALVPLKPHNDAITFLRERRAELDRPAPPKPEKPAEGGEKKAPAHGGNDAGEAKKAPAHGEKPASGGH